MLDITRTLERGLEIMEQVASRLPRIMDDDSSSLSRIKKAINRTQDVVLGEFLRGADEGIEMTAIFTNTNRKISKLLVDAENLIEEAQRGLVVPESMRDERQIF